jgi:hypothetical protein
MPFKAKHLTMKNSSNINYFKQTIVPKQDVLYWSSECVRFHDRTSGKFVEVAPRPSEVVCAIWCERRGVRFVTAGVMRPRSS